MLHVSVRMKKYSCSLYKNGATICVHVDNVDHCILLVLLLVQFLFQFILSKCVQCFDDIYILIQFKLFVNKCGNLKSH